MTDLQASQPPPRWPRLLGEMVVVAAGVFLGLAADAAWDARQDRALEARYLDGLLAEMRGAREELQLDNNLRSERLRSLELLQAEFDTRSAPDSLVWAWVNDGRGSSAFFPPTAVLDDLVSSGNLQLIASDDLRFALMAYAQERPRLRFTEDREASLVFNEYRPFLLERVSMTRFSPSSDSVDSLLASRTFENLVTLRLNQQRGVLRISGDMSTAIDRVIELLEADSLSAS